MYVHSIISLNNCHQHVAKPEIVAGGKVDFVNGWHTKFLPVQKSRGPPILRMKRILDTAKSIQLQNTNPLPDNHEVDDDISPKANPTWLVALEDISVHLPLLDPSYIGN